MNQASAIAIEPATVVAKTPIGLKEMQHRTLGLTLLTRRLLVLADGRRCLAELASFLPGRDIVPIVRELLDKGCIEAVGTRAGARGPQP